MRGYYYDVSALSGDYTAVLDHNDMPNDAGLCCYVLSGADTPTNWTEDTDTGTAVDIAVTSAADGVVIWAIMQEGDSDLTASGGETEAYDGQASGVPWYSSSGYYKAATSATTTSNIGMTSGTWRGVGLFVPSLGGTSIVPQAMANYINQVIQ
jgi:hypothetical protein